MNLLITGGAGFIGANLIHKLIHEPVVRRLVNLDCLTYSGNLQSLTGLEAHPKYIFEKVDLGEAAKVIDVMQRHEISHVMHLAAESHVDRSIAAPGSFIQTNVVGTYHLLEACRRVWRACHGCRFLHVSTDEVYGSLEDEGWFSEKSNYAPRSPYAATKAASDMLVRSYHHTYGLPAVITHSSNNYGPYQHPEKLIPVTIQCAVARTAIPIYGDGSNVRDWLYVADHVEALWRVLEHGVDGETYDIGASNEWPNLQIVERVCDLVDACAPYLGGDSRRLIAFVQDRPGHDWRYAIDATKIRRQLGWSPASDFNESLRATVEWYLQNQDWWKKGRSKKEEVRTEK